VIVFLTTSRHGYTVEQYRARVPGPIADRIASLSYREAADLPPRSGSTYVFTDFDRLTPPARAAAVRLADRYAATDGVAMLNHPSRSMRRYELLRTLEAAGINRFGAWRLDEGRRPRRYPVFIREEDRHDAPDPTLIVDDDGWDRAVAAVEQAGLCRERMLAVEYLDTRDADGIWRKYGAFRIGDAIVAGHVDHARQWLVKDTDLVDPGTVAAEVAFIEDNPYADQLRRAFDLARIEFGRADFAVVDGRIQVWEINVNPTIASEASQMASRRAVAEVYFPRIGRAFEALMADRPAATRGTRAAARPAPATPVHILTTASHADTILPLLARAAPETVERIRPLAYERVLAGADPPPGVSVFADIDRLGENQTAAARALHRRLLDGGSRCLNHPTRSMRRYELIRTLRARGLSAWDAVRLTEARRPSRFPVFLRHEDRHNGAISTLIHDAATLDRVIAQVERRNDVRDSVLVVEFEDTRGADGLYRKYSAYRIGDAILPREVQVCVDPLDKKRGPEAFTPAALEAERVYLETNPHADRLRPIFELARIDYGRIDYALHADGRLVVWEINTNPDLTLRVPDGPDLAWRTALRDRLLTDALIALADAPPETANGAGGLPPAPS